MKQNSVITTIKVKSNAEKSNDRENSSVLRKACPSDVFALKIPLGMALDRTRVSAVKSRRRPPQPKH
jgi:hypothetical protein